MKAYQTLCGSLLCFASLVLAPVQGAEAPALDFLNIGFGSVSSGMGQAGVADVGTPEGIYRNPASLAEINGLYLTGSVSPYLTAFLWHVSAAYKPRRFLVLAVSGYGMSFDAIKGDILYDGDPGRTLNTGAGVGSLTLATGIGKALKWRVGLDAGINAKVVTEVLDATKVSGLLFDLGALLSIPAVFTKEGKLSFGFTARNAGRAGIPGRPEPIPLTLLAGAGYSIPFGPKFALKALADVDFLTSDATVRASFGAEGLLLNLAYARVGYLLDRVDGARGLTVGAGLRLELKKEFEARIDYALAPLYGFGLQHGVQVGLAWKTEPPSN